MNLSSAIKKVKRIVPKRFRKPTLMEQRADLKTLKLRILKEELASLTELEDMIRIKGKTSKEVSMVKSKASLHFFERHFNIKLTPEQKQKVAELMARLEFREKSVKFFKRNPAQDETANKIRKELIELFPAKENYVQFLTTYRVYSSELKQIIKNAGY